MSPVEHTCRDGYEQVLRGTIEMDLGMPSGGILVRGRFSADEYLKRLPLPSLGNKSRTLE